MKSGFLSSEFLVTIIGLILGPSGVLILLADKLPDYGLAGVIAAQIIAAAAGIWRYIQSREAVKIASVPK